jgi:hypothetical protein
MKFNAFGARFVVAVRQKIDPTRIGILKHVIAAGTVACNERSV